MNRASNKQDRNDEAGLDLALASACLAGDVDARERLADRLAELPALIRIRHARLGAPLPHDLVEDVIQNVLLALWRKLASYDGRVPLLSWALGFATFEILQALAAVSGQRERTGHLADVVDRPCGPSLEVTERLAGLLARLSPEDRELLRLKHIENRTFTEIAARCGSPAASVKTRYYKALQMLRRLLRPGEEMPT